MSRIANERTILEIGGIVRSAQPHLDANSWMAGGAQVRRERHRYAGQAHSFSIETTDIRLESRGRCLWHLLVVTEQWHESGQGGADIRTSNWLKLLKGTNADVIRWIRECRPLWAAPRSPPADTPAEAGGA
jgi:hypothetical protein